MHSPTLTSTKWWPGGMVGGWVHGQPEAHICSPMPMLLLKTVPAIRSCRWLRNLELRYICMFVMIAGQGMKQRRGTAGSSTDNYWLQ